MVSPGGSCENAWAKEWFAWQAPARKKGQEKSDSWGNWENDAVLLNLGEGSEGGGAMRCEN